MRKKIPVRAKSFGRPRARVPSAWRQRGQRTRASILAVAERIFAELGPEGARTDVIAAVAGVNKALLYYYFRSKDELFRAVLEEHLTEFRSRALETLNRRTSVRTRIRAYINLQFDRIAARPYYPRLVHQLMTSSSKLVEALFR